MTVLTALAPLADGAGATISDGTIGLGVVDKGDLKYNGAVSSNCHNFYYTMRLLSTNQEALDCDVEGEGWGLGYDMGAAPSPASGGTRCWASTGSASGADSSPPPAVVSFTSTPTTATSIITCGSVRMTQKYEPVASHPELYKDNITVQNIGSATLTQFHYRRAMSWGSLDFYDDWTYNNIGVLPFGSLPPSVLYRTGLALSSAKLDPTQPPEYLVLGPPGNPEVYHVGEDLGMVWEFNFGDFLPGAKQPFTLYYGIAADTASAMQALSDVNAQVYNLAYVHSAQTEPDYHGPVEIMAFGDLPGIPPPPPVPPQASFKWTPESGGCGPHPVHFKDASVAGDAPIIAYQWSFGDGSTSGEKDPTHTYAEPGTYDASETVTDENGKTSTYTQAVTATAGEPCPAPTDPQGNPQAPRPPHDGVSDDEAGADSDGDHVVDRIDDCPTVANANQKDTDLDGHGDVCDTDLDGDSFLNAADNCPLINNRDQDDLDGDGDGDACDTDVDGDTVPDVLDNCPRYPNAEQTDANLDGLGDACEVDVQPAMALHEAPRSAPAGASGVSAPAASKSGAWLPYVLLGAAGLVAALVVAFRRRAE
ncbi:MAG: thrombospondin type 3 repeat-containing protein [bacterium]